MILDEKRQKRLLVAGWLCYTLTYLAKLNYSAIKVEIIKDLGISNSTAGMVSTLFFIAYGIGQFTNGMFTKHYNHRYAVTGAFLASALCNVLMFVSGDIKYMKFIWAANAISLSVVWSSLLLVFGKYMSEDYIKKALLVLGTTTTIGTAANYGSCSLVAAFGSWKTVFIIGATVMVIAAAVWFVTLSDVEKHASKPAVTLSDKKQGSGEARLKAPRTVIAGIVIMLFAVMLSNFVRDGLNEWTPNILYDRYKLPATLSIILTLLLPLLSTFGNFGIVAAEKKTKNLVYLCSVCFAASTAALTVIVLCLNLDSWIITLVLFCVVQCMGSAVAGIVTSHAPLLYRETVNSGFLAGVSEGFCYIGSAASTFGLGYIADKGGWDSVFYILLGVLVIGLAATGGYSIVERSIKQRRIRAGYEP